MFNLPLLSLLLITWSVIAGEVADTDHTFSSVVTREVYVQDNMIEEECLAISCEESHQQSTTENQHPENVEMTQGTSPTPVIPLILLLTGLVLFMFLKKSPSDK